MIKEVYAPNEREIREHMTTHIPFRSWCPCCIAGKGQSSHHRSHREQGAIPEIAIDYGFMGQGDAEDEPLENPILVTTDNKSKGMTAHTVAITGTYEYAIKRLMGDLRELGSKRMILKSDQ